MSLSHATKLDRNPLFLPRSRRASVRRIFRRWFLTNNIYIKKGTWETFSGGKLSSVCLVSFNYAERNKQRGTTTNERERESERMVLWKPFFRVSPSEPNWKWKRKDKTPFPDFFCSKYGFSRSVKTVTNGNKRGSRRRPSGQKPSFAFRQLGCVCVGMCASFLLLRDISCRTGREHHQTTSNGKSIR